MQNRNRSRSKNVSLIRMISAVVLGAVVLTILPVSYAGAQLEIDITRGRVEALPVAVPEFQGSSTEMQDLATKISGVVEADLRRSGLFRVIEKEAFIEKNVTIDRAPSFKDWRLIKTKGIVVGRISLTGDGKLQAEFRLWDAVLNRQLTGQVFSAHPDSWRRMGHIIADVVYERLTGEKGYFDTRVVFVDETGPKDQRVKRLAIMDQDGSSVRLLTDGSDLVLTPRFSPTRQEITYMSYESGKPRVYLYDLDSGQRQIVGDFPGMTFAPRFSPDGNSIIMSLSEQGVSNLFIMDLRTRRNRQLTNSSAIDTAPSFSPDGNNIVFESDRESGQQLYVMDINGQNIRRITKGEGRYSTPVWSPRGDLIAFTKQLEGRFLIGVMRPDGTGERILTEGYHNEGPTWSPNGRVLMFFRESRGPNGGPRLYTVDLTGYNERQIATPSFGSDPAWGPLIK